MRRSQFFTSLRALFCILIIALTPLSLMSCTDRGAPFEPFVVTSVTPPPGAVAVDKADWVLVAFNKPVEFSEVKKIQMKYAETGEKIPYGIGWEGGPMRVASDHWPLDATPWKPGRTVEVLIPADLTSQDGTVLGRATRFSFSVAIDSLPFAVAGTHPAQNDSVAVDQLGNVYGTVGFNDYYVSFPDSLLTISPPATIHLSLPVFVKYDATTPGAASFLFSGFGFVLGGVQPGTRYDLTIPRSIHDYEGETLAGDYHLVFYVK